MQISKTKVILLSFATVKKPQTVDVMVKAAGRDLRLVAKELAAHYPVFDPTQPREKPSQSRQLPINIVGRRGKIVQD